LPDDLEGIKDVAPAPQILDIDKSIKSANYVLDTLEQERIDAERRKAEEEQRRKEEEERKRLAEERRRAEEEEVRRIAAIKKPFEDAGFKVLHLDEENHRVLVITKDCVAKMPYHKSGGDVTWETCTLRQWLNNEFYENLPPQIKSLVIEVTNKNGAGNATQDRVFLLSFFREAFTYFESNDDRIAQYQSSACYWWLRSQGLMGTNYAACVFPDGSAEGIDSSDSILDSIRDGSDISVAINRLNCRNLGVRPALWLNL
jgi:hypothetical protein